MSDVTLASVDYALTATRAKYFHALRAGQFHEAEKILAASTNYSTSDAPPQSKPRSPSPSVAPQLRRGPRKPRRNLDVQESKSKDFRKRDSARQGTRS